MTGLLVALSLVVIAACDGLLSPSGNPSASFLSQDSTAAFRTDADSYRLRMTPYGFEGEIPVIFTNPTDAPVYVVNCRGSTSLWLEKWEDDRWIAAWAPITPDCLSPPIVVPAGGSHTSTVNVFGGYSSSNLYPQFNVATIPGVYRLVWRDVLWSFDYNAYPFGETVPLEYRISNRFELKL